MVGDKPSSCERVRGPDRLGSRDDYSLFAVLAAIIAVRATGRYQLQGNFEGSIEARSSSTPKPGDWFRWKSTKIRSLAW
jgi:hypothetical protein